MTERSEMTCGGPRPAEVVDVNGRHVRVMGVERQRHIRQAAPAGHVDQMFTPSAAQQEPVHEGAVDIPGEVSSRRHRHKGQPGAPSITGLGDGAHQRPRPGVGEEVVERLGSGDADRVGPARPQEASLRARPGVAQLARGREDAFADLLAHDPGSVEHVGCGAVRHARGLGHVP